MVIQIDVEQLRLLCNHVGTGISNDPRSAGIMLEVKPGDDTPIMGREYATKPTLHAYIQGLTEYEAWAPVLFAGTDSGAGIWLSAKVFCDYCKKLKGKGLVQLAVIGQNLCVRFKNSYVELAIQRRTPKDDVIKWGYKYEFKTDALEVIFQSLSGVRSGDDEEFVKTRIRLGEMGWDFYAVTRYRMALGYFQQENVDDQRFEVTVDLSHVLKVLKCIKGDKQSLETVSIFRDGNFLCFFWSSGDEIYEKETKEWKDKFVKLSIRIPLVQEEIKHDFSKVIPGCYDSIIKLSGNDIKNAYSRLDQIARLDPEQGHRMELVVNDYRLYILAVGAGVGSAREVIPLERDEVQELASWYNRDFCVAVNGGKLVEMFRAIKGGEKVTMGLTKRSVLFWWEQEVKTKSPTTEGSVTVGFQMMLAGMRSREGVMETVKKLGGKKL